MTDISQVRISVLIEVDKSEEAGGGRLSWTKVGQTAVVVCVFTARVFGGRTRPGLTRPGWVEQRRAMTDSGLPRC